ncbi:MAG: RDD family protein [Dehalococcoidia bacterium]
MRYAGFWRRFFALIIDTIVVNALAGLAHRFVGGYLSLARLDSSGGREIAESALASLNPTAIAITTLLGAIYFILLIGATGRTVGGILLGVRVIAVSGEAAGYGRAVIRWVAWAVLTAIPIVNVLTYLWMLWDDRRQTLHDKVAATIVVRR